MAATSGLRRESCARRSTPGRLSVSAGDTAHDLGYGSNRAGAVSRKSSGTARKIDASTPRRKQIEVHLAKEQPTGRRREDRGAPDARREAHLAREVQRSTGRWRNRSGAAGASSSAHDRRALEREEHACQLRPR